MPDRSPFVRLTREWPEGTVERTSCRPYTQASLWTSASGAALPPALPASLDAGSKWTDAEHHYRTLVRGAFVAWMLVLTPAISVAESAQSGGTSRARISVSVVIPPVFRVIQIKQIPGGHEYRIWTNMRSAYLQGRQYHFTQVGESTVVVPGDRDQLTIVHGL